jgi:DNA-binding HxlR family transcriptional regulator
MAFDERSTHLQLAIEIIADKWRIALLHLLSGHALRTSQLQRRLEDVSPKMLTQTLRGLERDGLVERVAYPEVPRASSID